MAAAAAAKAAEDTAAAAKLSDEAAVAGEEAANLQASEDVAATLKATIKATKAKTAAAAAAAPKPEPVVDTVAFAADIADLMRKQAEEADAATEKLLASVRIPAQKPLLRLPSFGCLSASRPVVLKTPQLVPSRDYGSTGDPLCADLGQEVRSRCCVLYSGCPACPTASLTWWNICCRPAGILQSQQPALPRERRSGVQGEDDEGLDR